MCQPDSVPSLVQSCTSHTLNPMPNLDPHPKPVLFHSMELGHNGTGAYQSHCVPSPVPLCTSHTLNPMPNLDPNPNLFCPILWGWDKIGLGPISLTVSQAQSHRIPAIL